MNKGTFLSGDAIAYVHSMDFCLLLTAGFLSVHRQVSIKGCCPVPSAACYGLVWGLARIVVGIAFSPA